MTLIIVMFSVCALMLFVAVGLLVNEFKENSPSYWDFLQEGKTKKWFKK